MGFGPLGKGGPICKQVQVHSWFDYLLEDVAESLSATHQEERASEGSWNPFSLSGGHSPFERPIGWQLWNAGDDSQRRWPTRWYRKIWIHGFQTGRVSRVHALVEQHEEDWLSPSLSWVESQGCTQTQRNLGQLGLGKRFRCRWGNWTSDSWSPADAGVWNKERRWVTFILHNWLVHQGETVNCTGNQQSWGYSFWRRWCPGYCSGGTRGSCQVGSGLKFFYKMFEELDLLATLPGQPQDENQSPDGDKRQVSRWIAVLNLNLSFICF